MERRNGRVKESVGCKLMKNELIELLSTYGYPVFEQGSLNEDDAYPDSFFTFWNDGTTDGEAYDNDAVFIVWNFTVYFYSVDETEVNTILPKLRKLLKQNGWIPEGVGYDVPSGEITHTGRAIDVRFKQPNEWRI